MKRSKVFLWSITAAVAGFLFGFDTAVISGADQPIQELWHLSDFNHGFFIMSMALWGTVLGALFGGIPCQRFGRKKTLLWIGVLYLISAVGTALAWGPFSFSFFRLLGGIGIGASSVAAPMYITEIAPADKRGRMVILYQFNIVLGIVIAYLSNYLLQHVGDNAWRWMLGVVTIPSLLFTILVLQIPESPRWLILIKRDLSAGRRLLGLLYPGNNIDQQLTEIENSSELDKGGNLFDRRYLKPVLLAFFIAFFNQLSGINFIIYYAPRIFQTAGYGKSVALLSTAGIGVINLAFTLIGMYLIDRAGRKKLMLIGSIGYIISLAIVSAFFYAERFDNWAIPIGLFLFIASHAIGQGAVIWVYIAEVFPTHLRAAGQSLGTTTHWVFAALITLLMPYVLNRFTGGPIFAFFAGMMVLQLLFVILYMPETKGVSLEELQKRLTREPADSIESVSGEVL